MACEQRTARSIYRCCDCHYFDDFGVGIKSAPQRFIGFALGTSRRVWYLPFLTLMVYWNNHHHLFQLVKRIDWRVMWANSLFMLAISMFPFATSWVGEGHVDAFGPELIYGFVVLMANISYLLLVETLRRVNGPHSELAALYNRQHNWKAIGSIIIAFVAMILALLWPPLTIILDLVMLLLWAIPDQRVERHLLHGPKN